jgi:DNA polymerase III delta prime subunit
MADIELDLVHIARLLSEGRNEEAISVARRDLRWIAKHRPDLAQASKGALSHLEGNVLVRGAALSIPVDSDSRLELLRREVVPKVPVEPTWPAVVHEALDAVLKERSRELALTDAGLSPTRSMLFVGPPGVGKTLAASWLALKLGRPLLTLDLAAVMSSFLGRTGNNIRVVLDFARKTPSVLLLDEFDAIAKRRDDATEVGELKRLVTVLLQAVDDWPADGLLLAATNHPELLDRAVWRRFERIIEFPQPRVDDIRGAIERMLGPDFHVGLAVEVETLAALLLGKSFSEVARKVGGARRVAVVEGIPIQDALLRLLGDLSGEASLELKLRVARELFNKGSSQRDVSRLTGLSRDTIRKHRVGVVDTQTGDGEGVS